MIYIKLKENLFATISDKDSELAKLNWGLNSVVPRDAYVRHTWKREGKRGSLLLHRSVMERILGCSIPEGMHVDHVDNNKLNNERSNLQLCTHAQNNAKRTKKTAYGYYGVHKHSSSKRYIVRVGKKYIGTASNPEEGALMYDKALKEKFPELIGYAPFNFPEAN